jgi:hypothetical protein
VRPGKRSTRAAEEPVTTRIRKHTGVPASEPMTELPPLPAFPLPGAVTPTEASEPTLADISLLRLDAAL